MFVLGGTSSGSTPGFVSYQKKLLSPKNVELQVCLFVYVSDRKPGFEDWSHPTSSHADAAVRVCKALSAGLKKTPESQTDHISAIICCQAGSTSKKSVRRPSQSVKMINANGILHIQGGEEADLLADLLSRPFSRVRKGRTTLKLARLSQPGIGFELQAVPLADRV